MIKKLFLSLAVSAAAATACYDPMDQWVAGLLFNNGEAIDLSTIITLGENGVNYIKEGEGDAMKVQYTSHYSPKASVAFGRFKASFQSDTTLPRLAIAIDTNVKPEAFDFDKAIARELDWLIANKALNVSESNLEKIKNGLAMVSDGNLQYWTKQDSALGYNSWFAEEGAEGVRSVKGVFAVSANGNCGSGFSFASLPEGLEQTTGLPARQSLQKPLDLAAQPARNGYFFRWNAESQAKSAIKIVTLSGRTLVHRPFEQGVNQWHWDWQSNRGANVASSLAVVTLKNGNQRASMLIAVSAF